MDWFLYDNVLRHERVKMISLLPVRPVQITACKIISDHNCFCI